MGCDMGPSWQEMMDMDRHDKQQSLEDPEGVRYLYQLHALIEQAGRPLQVVLCTDITVFNDVPVRAWWSHGRYNFNKADAPEHSTLVFDLPDKVCQRIQSDHAAELMRTFFGIEPARQLPRAIRPVYDDKRSAWAKEGWVEHRELIEPGDWDRLQRAIAASSHNQQYRVVVTGVPEAKARIDGDMLQLYVQSGVDALLAMWGENFSSQARLPDRHWF